MEINWDEKIWDTKTLLAAMAFGALYMYLMRKADDSKFPKFEYKLPDHLIPVIPK